MRRVITATHLAKIADDIIAGSICHPAVKNDSGAILRSGNAVTKMATKRQRKDYSLAK
jgi:hypothetical protein